MNTIEQIEELRKKQLSFFSSGKTKQIRFRKEALLRLSETIRKHDNDIKAAHKSVKKFMQKLLLISHRSFLNLEENAR